MSEAPDYRSGTADTMEHYAQTAYTAPRSSTGIRTNQIAQIEARRTALEDQMAKYDHYAGPVDAGGLPGIPGLGPRATQGQILDFVSEHYPGMIGFFNSNPEIRNLLTAAAREGWSPEKLQGEIMGTNWYRGTAASARDFEILEQTDPATAQAQVAATGAQIRDSAQTLGIGMSGATIAQLAWQANRNGWNDAQTVDALLYGLNWSTVEAGQLTANVDEIKDLAGDYLVDISDSTARQYSARMASGEMTMAGVESALIASAKGRFSWMASEIEQGVKPIDYFAPVRDTIARTLEVAPETINLMDPKWIPLVEVRDRDSGKMRAATLNEAMLSARNQSSFVNTQGAQEMSAGMIQLVQDAFGY